MLYRLKFVLLFFVRPKVCDRITRISNFILNGYEHFVFMLIYFKNNLAIAQCFKFKEFIIYGIFVTGRHEKIF